MKSVNSVFVLLVCLFAVSFFLGGNSCAEEEEGESVVDIVQRANMAPVLRDTVIELFAHLHLLENSFRDEKWEEAAHEAYKIDIFYNKLLKLSEDMNSVVELGALQSFEFSLVEIGRGIEQEDRKLVERRFLDLQPELFDILDSFTTIPLRLTASRYYSDLAIAGLGRNRFDVALDELGEIAEYMEQMADSVRSRGLDMELLEQQMSRARSALQNGDATESHQALQRVRQTLESFYQDYSLK